MRKLGWVLMVLVAGLFTMARAADNEPAETTVKLLNLEKVYTVSLEQQIAEQMEAEPRLRVYEKVVRDFYKKYLAFSVMRARIVKLYRQAFTPDELTAVNKFLATPAGRKWTELNPLLLKELQRIGQEEVSNRAHELEKAVADAARGKANDKE